MKAGVLVGAALLSAAAVPAYALNSSLEGGTGLINMRTADTLAPGSVDVSAFVWNDRYSVPDGGGTQSDLLLMPSVNYGVIKDLEVGASLPLVDNLDASTTGLRFVRGYAKYEFIDMPQQGIGVAVTAFGALSTTNRDTLSSGADNYGAELNLSLPRLLKPLANVYLSVGLEKTDTRQFGAVTYRREVKRKVDLGMDVPLRYGLDGTLELLYTRTVSTDDNLLVVPGLRYRGGGLTLLAGVGLGVPKNKSQPRWRLMAGISYVPARHHGGKAAAPPSSPPPLPTAPPVTSLPAPVVPSQGGAVPAPGGKGAAAHSQPGAARVEVLNASGVAGLGDRVAKVLAQKGYHVTHVGDADWSGQVQTQIFYSGRFQKEASKVARDIPGNQMVFEHQDLSNDIDVQVIVGQDQVSSDH